MTQNEMMKLKKITDSILDKFDKVFTELSKHEREHVKMTESEKTLFWKLFAKYKKEQAIKRKKGV